jgi:hypothetical protein
LPKVPIFDEAHTRNPKFYIYALWLKFLHSLKFYSLVKLFALQAPYLYHYIKGARQNVLAPRTTNSTVSFCVIFLPHTTVAALSTPFMNESKNTPLPTLRHLLLHNGEMVRDAEG